MPLLVFRYIRRYTMIYVLYVVLSIVMAMGIDYALKIS